MGRERCIAMAKKMIMAGRSSAFGLFKDDEADWTFRRTLDFMNEEAAEIGECLYVARRIDERDEESWIHEWADLATRVEAFGDKSLAAGHVISARECSMRVSNYYHTADLSTSPTHPKFDECWRKYVGGFRKGVVLFQLTILNVLLFKSAKI